MVTDPRNEPAATAGPQAQESTIDRRGFLKCMAWAGAGVVWTLGQGSRLTASPLGSLASTAPGSFSFVQISDSHIGFHTEGVNADVSGTLQQVIDRINALPTPPSLVLHTGDLTHGATAPQFDTVQQLMKGLHTGSTLYVPGEHDVIGDNGATYRRMFSPQSETLYYSLNQGGVHFIALSNIGAEDVFGVLGRAQLHWLKQDLRTVHPDTPIVVFAHVPLYAIYPQWGWYTRDAAEAMHLLQRFTSVTVLNGHIHQVMSHTEGRIRFHVATSTAFPQHHPGVEKPGPYKLAPDELLRSLGYNSVEVTGSRGPLAILDHNLA